MLRVFIRPKIGYSKPNCLVAVEIDPTKEVKDLKAVYAVSLFCLGFICVALLSLLFIVGTFKAGLKWKGAFHFFFLQTQLSMFSTHRNMNCITTTQYVGTLLWILTDHLGSSILEMVQFLVCLRFLLCKRI